MGCIASRSSIQRNALSIKGQHITGLHSNIRHRECGNLANSRVSQGRDSQRTAVEEHLVFICNARRSQHISIEHIPSRGCIASPSQSLVQELKTLKSTIGQWAACERDEYAGIIVSSIRPLDELVPNRNQRSASSAA